MANDKKQNPHIEDMDAEAHAKDSMFIKRKYVSGPSAPKKGKRKERFTLEEVSEWAELVKKHNINLGRPATREDLEWWRDNGDEMKDVPF